MPTLSTTYLIPAILLNPAFVLHLVNTFVSHLVPPSPPVISHSPHPFMESLGPVPGSTPYWDMHADDGLCWRYTAIMVVVQVLAFGRVQDNRVQRRDRKAAKAEKERSRREEMQSVGESHERKVGAKVMNGGVDGARPSVDNDICLEALNGNANGTLRMNGAAMSIEISDKQTEMESLETESEASLTETSEDEMMI
jgi:hypothetical protein